jgi:hypothetical protein
VERRSCRRSDNQREREIWFMPKTRIISYEQLLSPSKKFAATLLGWQFDGIRSRRSLLKVFQDASSSPHSPTIIICAILTEYVAYPFQLLLGDVGKWESPRESGFQEALGISSKRSFAPGRALVTDQRSAEVEASKGGTANARMFDVLLWCFG